MNNDKFKVRIWNVSGGYYLPDFYLTLSGEICEFGVFNGTPMVRKFDNQANFKKEYCTGLRDKNGKLIYEGDLLGESKEDDEFVEICWCDGLASFMCDIYPETYGNLETCDVEYLAKLKIIGNIHEMEVYQ